MNGQFPDLDDARSEATFTFRKRRFSRVKDVTFRSPKFMIRNLSWNILIKQTTKDTKKKLGFYLQCNGDSVSKSWTCCAYAKLMIRSQNAGFANLVRDIKYSFDLKKHDWGYREFIDWDAVLNAEGGFIKNDTVIFQVSVTADAPTGVSSDTKNHAMTNDSNWRATKSTIRDRHEVLFNNEFMADVHFILGSSDEERNSSKQIRIPAHKFILATGSEVFYAMFYGSLREEKGEIEIPDIPQKAFLGLLRYLYCDDIKLEDNSIMATLYAAEKYIVTPLFEACTQYLKRNLSKNNVCSLLSQLRLFNVPELSERCWEVIDAETEGALEADDFLDIDVSTLENILKRETLSCKEICLFEAALDWATQECLRNDLDQIPVNKRAVLGKILQLIRFPTMSLGEFANRVAPLGILSAEETANTFLHLTSSSKPSLMYSTEPRPGCKPS